MAWLLYRIGRGAFRHRRIVLGAWLVVFVGAIVAAGTLSGKTEDSFDLPGLESTDAFSLIKDRTPDANPDGAQATIVLRAPAGGQLDPEQVDAVVGGIDSEHVVSVSDPFATGAVSADGSTANVTVTYDVVSTELTDADTDALHDAEDAAEADGLEAAIGGSALQEMPEQSAAELIGIGIAALVLMVTFGSLVAAGMPLVNAIVATGTGVLGITAATGLITLGSSTPILASMLGLAVSIDYALFIVSRYRHEVAQGRSLEDAAGRAVGTAGSAVVFAGLTVIIALAALVVVDIRFLTEMGLAAAVTVALAVISSLTLLPALLGFAGDRIRRSRFGWLRRRDPELRPEDGASNGRRWIQLVTRHRIPVLLTGLVAAGVLAIPVASMQLSLPSDGQAAEGTGPRQAYDMISDSFGEGANGPLLVVVDTAGADDPEAAVAEVTAAIGALDDGIAAVVPADPPAPRPDATDAELDAFEKQVAAYGQQLEQAQYATITVIPEDGPADAETADLVHEIRDQIAPVAERTGADTYVSGQTAIGVDVSQKLADVFPVYLALVVGLAFILLVLVFRSILVPLKAVLGFLVTIGISLGVTVAVFQWGWGSELAGVDEPGPIMAMLPILMVGILFGLAMDYEVFLVSRMREEYVHGAGALDAIRTGFVHGSRVVAAAAVIMIGVFLGFVTSSMLVIVTIAVALAIGILADAFLVRMTLVPAFMALLGDKMWWLPTWLDRLLPDLDIEGEALNRRLEAEAATADRKPQLAGAHKA